MFIEVLLVVVIISEQLCGVLRPPEMSISSLEGDHIQEIKKKQNRAELSRCVTSLCFPYSDEGVSIQTPCAYEMEKGKEWMPRLTLKGQWTDETLVVHSGVELEKLSQ